MTPDEISQQKNAEVFILDYAHSNPVQTFVYNGDDWGLYLADGNVAVTKSNVIPAVDTDGVTSLAGSFTISVSLAHLDAVTSAHVHWTGTGVTVSYTVNGGTTWNAMTEDGVVPITLSSDFDIKFSFAGGVADDPSELTDVTVYVFNTERIPSNRGTRTLTFPLGKISGGLVTTTSSSISAVDTSATLVGGAPVGTPDPYIGTIEMWINPTSTPVVSGISGSTTTYVNGVVGTPTAGVNQHVVVVLSTRGNPALTIAPGTITHIALYKPQMTAQDVASLYSANVNGMPTVTISDSGSFAVTESSPSLDIYAYNWSVTSGGTQ